MFCRHIDVIRFSGYGQKILLYCCDIDVESIQVLELDRVGSEEALEGIGEEVEEEIVGVVRGEFASVLHDGGEAKEVGNREDDKEKGVPLAVLVRNPPPAEEEKDDVDSQQKRLRSKRNRRERKKKKLESKICEMWGDEDLLEVRVKYNKSEGVEGDEEEDGETFYQIFAKGREKYVEGKWEVIN